MATSVYVCMRATVGNMSAYPQRRHGSAASAGGSPLTAHLSVFLHVIKYGGATGCENINRGLPLFFGLIAEPATLTSKEFYQ